MGRFLPGPSQKLARGGGITWAMDDGAFWSRPPPLVLDFRGPAGSTTTVPAGCGFTRAACVDSVQTGTSTLVEIASAADVLRRGRALDAWEHGLVLEEARTNAWLDSRDPSTANWTLAGTPTLTPGQVSPSGDSLAYRIQAASGTGIVREAWPTAPSGIISVTLWEKTTAATGTNAFNTFALQRTPINAFPAGNLWGRVGLSFFIATDSGVIVADGRDWTSVLGQPAGARDLIYDYGQREAGGYPTEWTPTTRNASFLHVLGSTWSSRILAGRVGLELWLRPKGARSEYSGTRYLWWIDANNNVAFDASTGVLTVTIAGASNTTSAITWSRYADVKVYVEMGAGTSYVAVLIDGVRTVPTITGSALGSLSAGNLYLGSSNAGGHTCAWLYMQSFWSPGARPSWAW